MDVVRPQPGPPASPGCLRGVALLLVALVLAAGAVLAAVAAVLSTEVGGADGPQWAVLLLAVSGLLAAGCVAVLARLAARR